MISVGVGVGSSVASTPTGKLPRDKVTAKVSHVVAPACIVS